VLFCFFRLSSCGSRPPARRMRATKKRHDAVAWRTRPTKKRHNAEARQRGGWEESNVGTALGCGFPCPIENRCCSSLNHSRLRAPISPCYAVWFAMQFASRCSLVRGAVSFANGHQYLIRYCSISQLLT
jgi:hypothetical protein